MWTPRARAPPGPQEPAHRRPRATAGPAHRGEERGADEQCERRVGRPAEETVHNGQKAAARSCGQRVRRGATARFADAEGERAPHRVRIRGDHLVGHGMGAVGERVRDRHGEHGRLSGRGPGWTPMPGISSPRGPISRTSASAASTGSLNRRVTAFGELSTTCQPSGVVPRSTACADAVPGKASSTTKNAMVTRADFRGIGVTLQPWPGPWRAPVLLVVRRRRVCGR